MTKDARFEVIYRRWYARVWRYYRACRISDDEAHDLAQDAFKRFYEHMDSVRSEGEWPFLQKVARTVVLNWIRDRKAAKRSAVVIDIDSPDFTKEPAAEEELDYAGRQELAARRKALHDAISGLSESQRQCLQLWLDGFQYNEIAAALRITMDAVRSRLRDARKVLRSRLGGAILPEDDE